MTFYDYVIRFLIAIAGGALGGAIASIIVIWLNERRRK